ncbi:hypothetical protein CSOJ01_05783 [Colletotrichum sojae]|uniref:Uncharacterized protein n=1 Tax=Colletotrichum sojae TaxID=2175907 RepID=A0A8H6MW70_9PEZI|nr:hypothetical protein CSOJ01_05783 [Colletotrichum sojae]
MGYNQQGRCKMRDPGNGDIDGKWERQRRIGGGGAAKENEWPGKDDSQFSWDTAGSWTGSGTEGWDGMGRNRGTARKASNAKRGELPSVQIILSTECRTDRISWSDTAAARELQAPAAASCWKVPPLIPHYGK